MASVYIVQEMPNHNLTPAMRFGEMKVLLASNEQITFGPEHAIRRPHQKLRGYRDGDYLLLTGDPVAIGLTCAIAAFYNSDRYTALKWDRREHLYIPVKVDLKAEADSGYMPGVFRQLAAEPG